MQLGWQVDGFSYKEIKAANYGVTEEFVFVAELVPLDDTLLLVVFEVAAVLLAVEEVWFWVVVSVEPAVEEEFTVAVLVPVVPEFEESKWNQQSYSYSQVKLSD